MSAVKLCPFCNSEMGRMLIEYDLVLHPENGTCILSGRNFDLKLWNTRAPSPALDRLKEEIEKAPHWAECAHQKYSWRNADGTVTRGTCTCFKSRALSIIEEELK